MSLHHHTKHELAGRMCIVAGFMVSSTVAPATAGLLAGPFVAYVAARIWMDWHDR